jgi:GDPmannose 4,6-dehydratase
VREFVAIAFASVGLDWKRYVVVDQSFYRPAEKIPLCGNAAKAKRVLGWEATTDFALLVREMVAEDCRLLGLNK